MSNADPVQPVDIFLSFNTRDKDDVVRVHDLLKGRGVNSWLSESDLPGGRNWYKTVGDVIVSAMSAAVFVGESGLGPNQSDEIHACIAESKRRTSPMPIIPVLLPNAPEVPDLDPFLRSFSWVDLRGGITEDGIEQLIRGVIVVTATETTRSLVVERAVRADANKLPEQFVDAWGIAAVKSRLHALSEVVAQTALQEATAAANLLGDDILSIGIPVTIEMRWRRAFAAAIEIMLRIPESRKALSNFRCEEVPNCPVTEGVLSAEAQGEDVVIVHLSGHPALRVAGLRADEQEAVVESVNLHGRLGVARQGGMKLADRIGEVPVRTVNAAFDEIAAILCQNREVLAPLLARPGMPGSRWFLTEPEQEQNLPNEKPAAGDARLRAAILKKSLAGSGSQLVEEVFDAAEPSLESRFGLTRTDMRRLRSDPRWHSFAAALETIQGGQKS